MAHIEITDLYKVFGPTPGEALKMAQNGAPKHEIRERTGRTVALAGLSLAAHAGQVLAVMGLSGSGKSTLVRHINRLIEPTAGGISVDGVDVRGLGKDGLIDFRRRRIAMVFQSFGLFPHKRVIDNVAYGLEIRGDEKPARHRSAARWIDAVGLTGYEDAFPTVLSGGMRQRVGLARALATDADILLMDEPFSALDPIIRTEMQTLLLDLQANLNKTIVLITHDLVEAVRLGDKIAVLKDGRLCQAGTPDDILNRPADDHVRQFVAATQSIEKNFSP